MAITGLNASNTFSQWITVTQELTSRVNEKFVNFSSNTIYLNSNVDVDYDVNLSGNLIVTGNVVLDDINQNELNADDNVIVSDGLKASNAFFENLTTNGTLYIANVTPNVLTANVINSSSLTVNSNTVITGYINLNTFNVQTANVYSLSGNSINNIYQKVNTSNAFVFAQSNVSAFIAYSIGLG